MPDLTIPCPHCGQMLNVGPPDNDPDNGTVVMCWPCGKPSVFSTSPVGARIPTAEEHAAIDADAGMKAARLGRALCPEAPYAAIAAARLIMAVYDYSHALAQNREAAQQLERQAAEHERPVVPE